MRPGSLAILGVAAYSAFLVSTMPARWAAERLLPRPGRIAVQEIEGTVWKGSARALFGSHAGIFELDRVEWRFLPSRLLQGRAAYAVTLRGAGIEGRAELGRSFGGWSLRDLETRADAAVATAFAPLVRAWRPEGDVRITAPSLDFANPELRGELRVEWSNAATALSEVRPLGSYRAELAAEGASARLSVATLSGPLRVQGRGRVALPSRLTFSGEARADTAALQPLLDLLGPRRPDGSHAIEWNTR